MTVTGLRPIVDRFTGAQDHLRHTVRQHAIQEEARAVVTRAKSGAARMGGSTRLAGASVRVRPTGDGADIIGGGEGKGGEVFAGAEFGATGARKATYGRRGPYGNAYPVTRRTTRQFRPFVGRTGYFFWPAVRTGLRGVGQRVDAAIRAELGDHA